MTAFSIAYLYALGKGGVNDHKELEEYTNMADVSFDDVLFELNNQPNVSDFPDNDINRNAFPITSKVIKVLHSNSVFQQKVLAKLDFGQDLTKEMGNIYSGSVFGWLSAGLEEASKKGLKWSNKEALIIGYGSGDAAEVIPIIFREGWEKAVQISPFSLAFKSFIDLSKEQYIKLRSEKTTNGIDYHLNNQFVVKKVGTEERDDFQDAGIEYYEYLN
tara:strand:- start:1518 stop:2168 length:651 start_codon:yes stop_codon:yes gene_type:complete